MAALAPDTTSAVTAPAEDDGTDSAGRGAGYRVRLGRGLRDHRADILAVATFAVGALYITAKLWAHLGRMVYTSNDEVFFEWMLAHAAHSVAHLQNPLFTRQINAPDGVNLMGNTSALGLGIPLTPVTLLFGPHVAYLFGTMIAFAGTATAWYFTLRTIVTARVAAWSGALFCGFAPCMIAQASGHLNLISQFLAPPIALLVCRLGRPGRPVRRAIVLGLLITYQVFISEELLLFIAMAVGLFVILYAVLDRRTARERMPRFLAELGGATLTAGILLAYPLWFQFFGPQHYRGLPYAGYSYFLDVGAYGTYGRQALTGFSVVPGLLSPNTTEENAFFGLALLVLCVVIAIWLWRSPVVKGLVITALVFAALSLGLTVQVNGKLTGVPGPLRLIEKIPLLDLAVPARFPLIVTAAIGLLLALSIDRVWAIPRAPESPLRLLWLGAVVAVLLPSAPLPLRTYPSFSRPEFISSGQWRQYAPPGRSVIAVPPDTGGGSIVGMFWSGRADTTMAVPGGYFIGPTTPTDITGRYGAFDRPTALLLGHVADTGEVPDITDQDRQQAIADLRYWRGSVVVLARVPHEVALHSTLDQLFGASRSIGGAWVWDVRPLVG